MNFDEYQTQARMTKKQPRAEGTGALVSFLGLAGETGELLNEYKKYLRDGSAHERFEHRLREEMGDLLWYLADAASEFNIGLSEVASANLAKVREPLGRSRPRRAT